MVREPFNFSFNLKYWMHELPIFREKKTYCVVRYFYEN